MRQRDVAKAKEKASSTLFEWLDTKEKIKTCIQPLKWLTYTNRVCWADRRSAEELMNVENEMRTDG